MHTHVIVKLLGHSRLALITDKVPLARVPPQARAQGGHHAGEADHRHQKERKRDREEAKGRDEDTA